MVREIWFKKSGSRKVVDQKKRWFYTINPHFFRLEKSGWPEKKIRVWRTTFLKPLFYTFPEIRSQNKRSTTGPEQSFPWEVFLTGKNLFSLQGTTILIAGTLFSLQGFPCEKNFTEKTLFSLQGMGVQCRIVWTKTLRPISQS